MKTKILFRLFQLFCLSFGVFFICIQVLMGKTFKADEIPLFFAGDNISYYQYPLQWHYFFLNNKPTPNQKSTKQLKQLINKKNYTVPFTYNFGDIYLENNITRIPPFLPTYVYNAQGKLVLQKWGGLGFRYFHNWHPVWNPKIRNRSEIDYFILSPTYDGKMNIIDIDTFWYPLTQSPYNLFIPSLKDENNFFQLNYEIDTLKLRSYFRIKLFRNDTINFSIKKVLEKKFYDSLSAEVPDNNFFRNLKPDTFYKHSLIFPTFWVLRADNNKDWWIFKLYLPFFSYNNPDSNVCFITLYYLIDDGDSNFRIIPINKFKIFEISNNLYPMHALLTFSPNLNLISFQLFYSNLTQKLEPGYIDFNFTRIYLFNFDNKNGNLTPISNASDLGSSFIEYYFNIDSLPAETDILNLPFFVTPLSFPGPIVSSPISFFSFSGDVLYVDRWKLSLSILNLDSIRASVTQWLQNKFTSLDWLERMKMKTLGKFFSLPKILVGQGGSVIKYLFFPTYKGKWYLVTLSFLDSLSSSIFSSINKDEDKYYDSTFIIRYFQLNNMDSFAKEPEVEFLFCDTIKFPHSIPNDSDYIPFNKPYFTSRWDSVFATFFFSPLDGLYSSIYFEYFYPPRGVLALGPSEVCEGEEIHLEGTMHLYPDTSAQYYWYGPNGWQDTGRIVIIRNAQINNSGKYICKAVFADTTFSSEVYVQVVPRPKITFERAVPRYICNGEPYTVRITFPRWGRQNYWILWSTGDTVEAVTISNSGEYWVKVWDENGCTDSVGFKVEYVDTAVVRILKEKEYICTGERIWLEVEEGWDSIQWSTGETSRRIYVERGGNYRVEVRNRFGCVAQGETTVEEVNLELELPKLVDFGRVHLWTTEERRVGIVNTSGSRITGSINYVGSEEIEVEPRGRFAIDVGDSIEIVAKCRAKGYGLKEGKVFVEVDSPCVKIWEIEMQGRGTGVVKVWTIDSVVVVGEKDFCIPIYSKVEVGGEDTVIGWQGEVVFERGLMATGEGSIVGEERVVKFSGEVKMDTMVKEIGRICGDILLPERRVVAIDIRGFEFGENYEVNEEDGRLRVVGVCEPELSQVEIRNALRLTIIPNPASEKFKFRIEGERGKEYKIKINDLLGKSIEEVEGKFEGSEVEIEFEGKELGKGMFFGQLCSGGECVIQAFWIW